MVIRFSLESDRAKHLPKSSKRYSFLCAKTVPYLYRIKLRNLVMLVDCTYIILFLSCSLATMPPFLDSVESYFGTRDLYEALGVEKTAKEGELRRAYHRLSLKVHPDRVPPDQIQEATEKFQVSSCYG